MPKPVYFVYIFCLLSIVFCKQKNQLAQNETALVKELVALDEVYEEPEVAQRTNKNLNIPEQSRKADSRNPPIVLDIISARLDVRDTKLTDFYPKVKYIPIRFNEPVDSTWNRYADFEFLITPNNIIASQFSYGISQFDLHGNFMNQIVKNDFFYTTIPGRKSVMVSKEDRDQFVGTKGIVHAIGDIVYYQYHNVPENIGALMHFNASPGELSSAMLNLDANPINKPKGGQLFDLQTTKPQRGAVSQLGANSIFPITENEWATSYSKFASGKSGSFMVSTNLTGDTICEFTDHDPIRNYSGGAYRAIDQEGSQYNFHGIRHIRQGYNDTIYTVKNATQLIPKYVLDFGKKGIQSPMEVMNSKVSLAEKYIINDLVETNNYLFIIYTQNAPSPNSAKKGNLFYNACIYDKTKGELFHVYMNKSPFVPVGRSWPQNPIGFLANDFDNGPSFWPKKTTHDGKPFMWFKGLDLKLRFEMDTWTNEAFSIKNMKDDDYLLMLAY